MKRVCALIPLCLAMYPFFGYGKTFDQVAAEAEADATAMGARIRRFFGLGSR